MTDNVAKNLLINVSIGNADRAHTIEEFYEAIRKVIPRKYNVVMMSGHYLVDGKVCRPQDYDPETQDFLPGRTPPPWAGGPPTPRVVEKTVAETKPLSPEESLGHAPSRSKTTGRRTIARRPRRSSTD